MALTASSSSLLVIVSMLFLASDIGFGIGTKTPRGSTNIITPLMVYLPFIVLVCQRYRKKAGMRTVFSMVLPYTGIVLVTWTIFFVIWYLLGIPWGPGAPVHL